MLLIAAGDLHRRSAAAVVSCTTRRSGRTPPRGAAVPAPPRRGRSRAALASASPGAQAARSPLERALPRAAQAGLGANAARAPDGDDRGCVRRSHVRRGARRVAHLQQPREGVRGERKRRPGADRFAACAAAFVPGPDRPRRSELRLRLRRGSTVEAMVVDPEALREVIRWEWPNDPRTALAALDGVGCSAAGDREQRAADVRSIESAATHPGQGRRDGGRLSGQRPRRAAARPAGRSAATGRAGRRGRRRSTHGLRTRSCGPRATPRRVSRLARALASRALVHHDRRSFPHERRVDDCGARLRLHPCRRTCRGARRTGSAVSLPLRAVPRPARDLGVPAPDGLWRASAGAVCCGRGGSARRVRRARRSCGRAHRSRAAHRARRSTAAVHAVGTPRRALVAARCVVCTARARGGGWPAASPEHSRAAARSERRCALPETMLLVENVSKRYAVEAGVVEALHDVDAEIPRAAVTALVGVSGSGKSTLLRLLAGLEAPTRGRVVADGVDLTAAGAAGIRRFSPHAGVVRLPARSRQPLPAPDGRRAPSGATQAGGSSGSGSPTAGTRAPRSSRAASSRARHSPSRSPATPRSWSSTNRRRSSTTRAHGHCSTHLLMRRASARPSWSPRTTLTCSRSPITWSSSRGAETRASPLILRRLR